MPIQVICPGCHTRFKVGDQHAGKAGACPKCKGQIQIPALGDEVVIHAPEMEAGATDAKGRNVLKPLKRKETKFNLNAALIIGGGTLLAVALAFLVGNSKGDLGSSLKWILAGGAALLGPPLAYAGYFFLRNDEELDGGYRGQELLVRCLICGLLYAATWGVYWYIGYQFFELGEARLELFQIGILLIPLLLLGAAVGTLSFDFEPLTGFFHYTLYFVATVLLRGVMFLPLLPGMGEGPADKPTAPRAASPAKAEPTPGKEQPPTPPAPKAKSEKKQPSDPADPVSAF